jgi:large subunit ribosomal protein L10
MDRDEKKKNAESLHEELKKAKGIIFSKFQGITVAQDFELRRRIAGTGARYKVVKNTLIERAAKGTTVEPIAQKLAGTTSVALTEADPVALAKVLTEYAKGNPVFSFKSGVVEGRVVSLADFGALATLPSKEQLLSKILFLFNSPAQRVVSTLSGVARNLVYVIQEGVKEGKFLEKGGNQESGNSDGITRLKVMIDRKLGVGRDTAERKRAADGLRASGPADFDSVLPTLGEVGVGKDHPNQLPRELFDGLPDAEKQQVKSHYESELDKLGKESPGTPS